MPQQKRAFITGSSRGIGRAVAMALAAQGYEIILHGASMSQKLEEVRAAIEALGQKVSVETANLCNLEETTALAGRLEKVDVLVLNASLQYRTPWQEITIEESEQQLNCNLLSSLILIQSCVNDMKKSGWGRIVTIGSVQETKPHPDMLIYSASKAAQTNMVRSLALQLAKDGITVNNVAPGVIYTDRNREALSDEAYAKKVTSAIPLGFYGKPEDCANVVAMLCSDSGRYITGQSIYVDGGKSIQ